MSAFGNKKTKTSVRLKRFTVLLVVWSMLLFLLVGCGSQSEQPAPGQTQQTVIDTTSDELADGAADQTTDALADEHSNQAADEQTAAEPADQTPDAFTGEHSNQAADEQTADKPDQAEPGEASAESAIDEDGSYTSKEDVALYLHTYEKLPSNFITKKDAKKLGWEGGSLEAYAPGKCIGGDRFGNYEGVLPDGSYHECDIGTLGKSGRGAKRIVYSDDGRIYYTDDHYETFEQLY